MHRLSIVAALVALLCALTVTTNGRAEPPPKRDDTKAADPPSEDEKAKPADPPPSKGDAAKPDEAKPDEAKPPDPPPAKSAPKSPPSKPAKPASPKSPPAKPQPAKPPSKSQPSETHQQPTAAPAGALVVSVDDKARPHARELARVVYQDALLRPLIDEKTAQILSGEPAPADDERLARHASVVRAIRTAEDDEVRRRLAGSLARDLNARLVVLVSVRGDEPTARIVRMPDEQLLAVKLTANKVTAKDGTVSWDWKDATSMMRELAFGAPPPGPRKPKKSAGGTALPPPEPEDSEDDGNLLTSPWFWGGLGLVVTVGATVLILSQTALNEPDVVLIEGRIAP